MQTYRDVDEFQQFLVRLIVSEKEIQGAEKIACTVINKNRELMKLVERVHQLEIEPMAQ